MNMNERKALAEFRMEIFDALPRQIRQLINEHDATESQMLVMLDQVAKLERMQPPDEGRLYRTPRR